jgi:hypothetical protein
MIANQVAKALGVVTAIVAIAFAGMLIRSPRVQAQDDDDDRDSNDPRIEQGFDISPVKLDLDGKNRRLVGLGSYIVNAQGDCNGCHTNPEFASGGNPYFLGQKKKIDPKTFLGGGVDFGSFGPGSPDIVSRNLTPDKTGRPEGGRSFAEFRQILRTGIDLDQLHPSCSATLTTNCLPAPFDGSRLQIMPWPTYQGMTDHDLRAIYEYLRAIPCVAGPPAPSPLHNDCDDD